MRRGIGRGEKQRERESVREHKYMSFFLTLFVLLSRPIHLLILMVGSFPPCYNYDVIVVWFELCIFLENECF